MLLKRANAPLAVLRSPVVLLKSAPAPVAVFSFAVFSRSVPAPTPVLKLPLVGREQRIPTICCVPSAGREVLKGVLPFCRRNAG